MVLSILARNNNAPFTAGLPNVCLFVFFFVKNLNFKLLFFIDKLGEVTHAQQISIGNKCLF